MSNTGNGANLGFERELWQAADALRSNMDAAEYKHVIPGFCKSAAQAEIEAHGYVLTPGRYVGAAPVEDDGEPFEEKMTRLVATLCDQRAEAVGLDFAIQANL